MGRILDYKIVNQSNLILFNKIVREAIEERWQPLGGVQVINNGQNSTSNVDFFQTLVKYDWATDTGINI